MKPHQQDGQTGTGAPGSINDVVYRDARYLLGRENGVPCLIAGCRKFKLTCHPYEPCLYITDEHGVLTAVHNAFDPGVLLDAFRAGNTVTSITGREYTAEDFCRMAEYAAGRVDLQIDDAERALGARKEPDKQKEPRKAADGGKAEENRIAEGGVFCTLLEEYPDSAVDICIVKDALPFRGYESHWRALLYAARRIFIDEDDIALWHYDVGKANGARIPAKDLFAPEQTREDLNFRSAFCAPPYGRIYTDADFEKLCRTLFPQGFEQLEVYTWSTDWSEYFDDGHEWWGTLCLTVYDGALDRFTVIFASATD